MNTDKDQTAKKDAGKLELTLVPLEMLKDIAVIRRYGIEKYPDGGRDNWKRVSVERYRDATFRHWVAYLEDPYGVDAESGLPHLWHWLCNASFLADLEKDHFKEFFNHEEE